MELEIELVAPRVETQLLCLDKSSIVGRPCVRPLVFGPVLHFLQVRHGPFLLFAFSPIVLH